MPNWAEGTIKFRGKEKDIIDLIKSEFVSPYDDFKVTVDEDEAELNLSAETSYFYISGTRRAFILNDKISIDKISDDETMVVEINNFRQAWAAVPENYIQMSESYNVDIKIFTFERGMEFTQEIEITNGVVIKDISKEYDDYEWEVPFASMGG